MLRNSFIWGLILSLLIAVSLAYGAWRQLQAWLFEPVNITQDIIISVAPGSSMQRIAMQLQQAGLTPNASALAYYARFKGADQKLQAGEYLFSGQLDADALLAKLVAGSVVTYSITVPEGFTYDMFVERLMAHPMMQGKAKPEFSNWAAASDYTHPEGLLMPSTYLFSRQQTPQQVVQQAFARQQQVLDKLWPDRAPDLPYQTPYEALIMASIIEKETGLASEREAIAGVFVRRLQKGMRLQTDPTVIYGIGASFDGNITRKHLRQKTPYNTYVIYGLPPTPIALPGEDAIYAALHPAQGDALYFVAKGDGSHAFSATLSQHQAYVRQYQLKK